MGTWIEKRHITTGWKPHRIEVHVFDTGDKMVTIGGHPLPARANERALPFGFTMTPDEAEEIAATLVSAANKARQGKGPRPWSIHHRSGCKCSTCRASIKGSISGDVKP